MTANSRCAEQSIDEICWVWGRFCVARMSLGPGAFHVPVPLDSRSYGLFLFLVLFLPRPFIEPSMHSLLVFTFGLDHVVQAYS